MPQCVFIRTDDHDVIRPVSHPSLALNPEEGLADEMANLPPNGEHQHGNKGREECRDPDCVSAERTQRSHFDDPDIFRRSSTYKGCLLYTSPSPRDRQKTRMPSSA